MDLRGYKVLVEPFDSEGTLRGRVLMQDDDVRFSAPDMMRFRKEAVSAVEFYLSACEAAGRQPAPPVKQAEWVALSDQQRERLRERAKAGKKTVSRVLNEIVTESLGA